MSLKILKILKGQEGSFTIDIFLLPLMGVLIIYLAKKLFRFFGSYKYAWYFLSVIGVIIFWGLSGGLYCDFFNPPDFISSLTGNDFMWNWSIYPLCGIRLVPLAEIPTCFTKIFGFWNLLSAFFFLVLYPMFLFLGLQLGWILWGSSEKQKGAIDLFFPRPRDSKNPFN